MKLSSLSTCNLWASVKMIVIMPFALFMRRSRNIWIVTERPNQARDNGYVFFKYMKEKHPEKRVYYIIDKKAKDVAKLKKYSNVIQFDSLRHFWYFCLSSVHISAHVGGCVPSHAVVVRRIRGVLKYADVFLPHGVSYGVSEFCLQKYAKINLFICSGRPEYENVLKNYGYSEYEVAYTGFPRLDEWHHIMVNPKLILVMPTWRLYLAQNPNTVFKETTYFKAYQELLSLPKLHYFLMKNEMKLVFYLHHEMRKYVDSFKTNCHNIEIVRDDNSYDIQELLKSSALLITDYSSVHFDFAYMGKPVIYYQFDKEDFFTYQYSKADFNAEKDGFGPVAYTAEDVVKNMEKAYKMNFNVEAGYDRRMRTFYQLHDEHNCDRVYDVIQERICGI